MDFIDKQISPPKSWEKFEDLARSLFAAVWKSPLAQKNGRTGQKQHGVDVYGTPEFAAGKIFGVQCKGKSEGYGAKATVAEFDAELAKAENFKPALAHWSFFTTAPNDAHLQEHARLVSTRREKEGEFPVVVIGWDTIQALLSSHQAVVEEFYPEHVGELPKVMAALRALPSAEEIDWIRRSLMMFTPRSAAIPVETSAWTVVPFETARDLGAALMGRPLGPADVAACPTLPEVALLIDDLERAGSSRLAGMPGAGKSISVLQVARQIHDRGWRVLRLLDPMGGVPSFDANLTPTLYIVDDAHLARPALLRALEEQATATRWVLSAHTISRDKESLPGTGVIQLDAKRAVRVIADGLQASPETTLAAVRRVDDRVGDRSSDEPLDRRLEHAADISEYPWQFCFVLGGGWRRASAIASSARAAGADVVLAAAAIRQLASRDARCSRDALMNLIDAALPVTDSDAAITWLVAQRLLLGANDLRCPHQRLASVLLARILEGQSIEERRTIAYMLKTILGDHEIPLGGLSVLLHELSFAGEFRQWSRLVHPAWLAPILARCWGATEALDIRDACWVLTNLHGYLPEEMKEIAVHQETLVGWLHVAPEGACYALGRTLTHVLHTDKTLGSNIVAQVNPSALALAISTASALHAGEVANLLSTMYVGQDEAWKARFLKDIDRNACRYVVSTWPKDAYLSIAADFCEYFCYVEPEFGFTLIEAMIPAIADRLRADPQEAFRELHDIVWNSLRLYDPLCIYVGKLAPSRRMRQVGRRICACWAPKDLAAKLSCSTHRSFQAAAGLLSFMRKASPKQFEETVLALDWGEIDKAIGTGWAEDIDDARMLLGVVYALPAARVAIQAMVERNEPRIISMSTHLAAFAPASALRHIAAGKHIALCRWGHVDWDLGAFVLANVLQLEPTLTPTFLEPHYRGLAEAFSQPSPSFYNDGLLFLRLLAQVEPYSLVPVLDQIDVNRAQLGWRNALRGREGSREPGAKAQVRQVVSLLIHHALDRDDAVGKLARQLRRDFPSQSVPSMKILEPIDLAKSIE